MYQDCSMRETKVADSPIFCDNTENTKLFIKKKVVKKNTLRMNYSCWWVWYLRIAILTIKFSLKLKILTFWTKFAQKVHFWLKKKKVNTAIEFCIIRISPGTKFQLKLIILTFWTKLAQKGNFWSKIKKVNITIEFCIFELL